MKKTALSIFLSLLVIATVFSLTVFSDGEANFAEIAPGGEITSVNDVKTVFGEENVTVEAEGETVNIYFERSIKLASPIVIKSGTYRIFGRDCVLFRGFDVGSLVVLDGTGGAAPRLIISEVSSTDWESGKIAVFTFDGNASQHPDAHGALITVKGNATVDFDGKIMLKNAVNKELGGAIYAEAVANGSGGFYSPTVKLKGCKITGCVSLKGGGGIALLGGKDGEGEITLTDVILEKNKAQNTEKTAMGGAFYLSGGKIKLSGSVTQVIGNSGDLGGGGYVCGYAEIEGITVKDNTAGVSGGALYCSNDTQRGTSGTLAMNNTVLSYNTSTLNGGTVFNGGTLLIGGSTYITDGKAGGDGGAVYNVGSFGFSAGDIITNKADGKAGAIYNGVSGILIISGGRISSNDASLCGGIYSEGVFEFKGGSIGKSMGKAPQNLVCGIMRMGETATFTDTEVIGLLVKDGQTLPVINVLSALSSRVKQTVAFFTEFTDENGALSVKLVNDSGMKAFNSENGAALESAVKGFKVLGEGLKNYKISSDGELVFKAPIMPIWAWILTLIGIAGAAYGVIYAVKAVKRNKTEERGDEKISETSDGGDKETSEQ